jgi:hypothetical protein
LEPRLFFEELDLAYKKIFIAMRRQLEAVIFVIALEAWWILFFATWEIR